MMIGLFFPPRLYARGRRRVRFCGDVVLFTLNALRGRWREEEAERLLSEDCEEREADSSVLVITKDTPVGVKITL